MSFEDLLKSLQQDYLATLPEKIAKIQISIESASTAELRDCFHKLKGTGRTYGLPEVSELAEVVEQVCIALPKEAAGAATLGAAILGDIHSSRTRAIPFDLHADSRFQQIRKLAAPSA